MLLFYNSIAIISRVYAYILMDKINVLHLFAKIIEYDYKKERGYIHMKKFFNVIVKLSTGLAPMALMLATMTANSTCYFYTYQPDVPAKLITK